MTSIQSPSPADQQNETGARRGATLTVAAAGRRKQLRDGGITPKSVEKLAKNIFGEDLHAATGLTCKRQDCLQFCEGLSDESPDTWQTAVSCQAENLSANGYECHPQTDSGMEIPGPKAGGACQTEICAHQCDPNVVLGLDEVTFTYCGC